MAKRTETAPVDPKLAARAGIVDELGDLEAQAAPYKPLLKRIEQLRSTIRSWGEALETYETTRVAGQKWVAAIGAREDRREVDVKAAHRLLGAQKFFSLCRLPVSAIETLPADVLDKIVSTAATGPRAVQIYPRT